MYVVSNENIKCPKELGDFMWTSTYSYGCYEKFNKHCCRQPSMKKMFQNCKSSVTTISYNYKKQHNKAYCRVFKFISRQERKALCSGGSHT